MRTYGYDYSFAISTIEVNKILVANLQNSDLELKYNGTDPTTGVSIDLNAKMSPWQLIKGGQNTLLRFSIPFKSGSLVVSPPLAKNYDLSTVSILIEVSLGWLGSGSSASSHGSGNETKLIFTPTQTTDPSNPGYVSVVNILDPNKKLDTVGLGLLRQYTKNILVENKSKIQLIFADVFPQPSKVGSWLVPKKWDYYYSTGKDYDALCFLCLLSDKSLPTNPAFDSSALSGTNNSVILIAQEIFFENVILPSIKSTFNGGSFVANSSADETSTIVNKSNFTIKTKKGNIEAKDFKLSASDQGNGLKVSTSGGGPLKFFFGKAKLPNASYSWSCENTNPLKYSNNMISFAKDHSPTLHHNQTIHWYDWVILVSVGITSLPGLISFIVDAIEDFSDDVNAVGIGNINSNLASATSNSVVNLSNLIDWTSSGGQKFAATNAGLNGALFVHGNIT